MRSLLGILLAVLAAAPAAAQERAQQRATLHRFTVPLHDGALHVDELLRALLAEYELDADGLGEAGGDLMPESVFLQQMAARQRCPKVHYHSVLGTKSILRPEQLDALRAAVRQRLAGDGLAKVVRPRLEAWLADLDELVDGRGDGAVSIASGALDGVEPVLVPVDHLGLVRRRGLLAPRDPTAEHPVFARVAGWVEPPK